MFCFKDVRFGGTMCLNVKNTSWVIREDSALETDTARDLVLKKYHHRGGC